MHLQKFEQTIIEAFECPHYKYKSVESCLEAARNSFNRLDPDRKALVVSSWLRYLEMEKKIPSATEVNPDSIEFKQILQDIQVARFVCQTNLYTLCLILEQYSQVNYRTHGEICLDFFVQKDPIFRTFEEFANQYSGLKERMLLTPRGSFKSTLDMADCVQWVLNFPEITIAVMTGVYQLAIDFVGEIRGHFTLEETPLIGEDKKPIYAPKKLQDRETGEWSQSAFQYLFPEHCTKPGDSKLAEWQTPAGGVDKEPTVRAASIEATLSGWHFGILKLDDVVTNENSQTVTRLEAVNKQISINAAMLNPFGFLDCIGTWYDSLDHYGIKIKQEEDLAKEEGLVGAISGSVDSGRFNSNVYTKIYLRACWWLTEDAESLGKIEEELTKKDLELFFPERLTYEFLKKKQKTDPYFAIKYLNNPRKHHQVKFPRELLIRRTISHSQVPHQGMLVATVDTAYSIKSWADYTVMITALIYGGRFYIVNMVRGRYNEFELPAIIASTANKWKHKRIVIEDSVGVKWMGRELRREMDKLRISVPVEFVSLGYGSKANSKKMKAKPVVRLLGDERLLLVNSCEGLNDIYHELEQFTGTADDVHDDIVSALSLLAEHFGAYADMEAKINLASTEYVADKMSEERHKLIYGLGKHNRYNAMNSIEDNPRTVFELEQMNQQALSIGADINPLEDLF